MSDAALPPLLSVAEFKTLPSDVVVIDASWSWDGTGPRTAHVEARIPGAILFDHAAAKDPDSDLHETVPTASHFSAHLSALGIGNDDRIVLYSQGAFSGAARAWYLLRLFGHRSVSVLDGGFDAYIASGLPIESGTASAVAPTQYTATFVSDLIVDIAGMRRALEDGVQTIDGRPGPVYEGAVDFFAEQGGPAAGQPGRIADMPNIPTSEFVTDGKLKSASVLRVLFEENGVDLTRPIVTSCSLGVGASGVAFALALAGADKVAVFDGSYEAWVASA